MQEQPVYYSVMQSSAREGKYLTTLEVSRSLHSDSATVLRAMSIITMRSLCCNRTSLRRTMHSRVPSMGVLPERRRLSSCIDVTGARSSARFTPARRSTTLVQSAAGLMTPISPELPHLKQRNAGDTGTLRGRVRPRCLQGEQSKLYGLDAVQLHISYKDWRRRLCLCQRSTA
ncbi:hypothetical protein GY45DRAFT_441520 [Cubamyces sp. BRFM 1775]|nr:hypothetical protein GY45DRAFT_441520 [Cubamyces sp. BRFM 1775]